MRLVVTLALLMGLSCGYLPAQDQDEAPATKVETKTKAPPPDPKTLCHVSGIVTVAGNGAPLKKVGVSLAPQSFADFQPTNLLAFTDATGRFHLDDVPPGKYWLLVKRQGYYRNDPNVRGALMNRSVLVLQPGEKNDKLTITMSTGGLITGRLTDNDGEPVRWVSVKALRLSRIGVRKIYKDVRAAQSNDIGEYRLYDLPPGNYFVSAEPSRQGDEDMLPSEEVLFSLGRDSRERYAPTYFPGATDPFLAQPIKLEAGAEVRADMLLTPLHAVKVSGSVNKPKTLMASVIMVPKGYDFTLNESEVSQTSVDEDGKFTVENVPPGQYNLMAWGILDRKLYYDRSEFTVSADNVKGIQLEMKPMLDIQGRVTVEGIDGPQPDLSQVAVSLVPDGGELDFGGGYGQVAKDGALKFANLLPGKYKVRLEAARGQKGARDLYLKSLRFGGKDVLDSSFELNSTNVNSSLEVVLSPRVATFEGGTVDDDSKPVPSATVVVVPKGGNAKILSRYFKTVSDQNGHFVLSGLAPGDYTMYAWEQDPSPGRYEGDPDWIRGFTDEDFLRSLEGKGASLKIHEGISDTGKIKVIKAESDE